MVQNKLTGTSLHGIIGPIVEAITILHPRQERPGRTIDTSLVLGRGPKVAIPKAALLRRHIGTTKPIPAPRSAAAAPHLLLAPAQVTVDHRAVPRLPHLPYRTADLVAPIDQCGQLLPIPRLVLLHFRQYRPEVAQQAVQIGREGLQTRSDVEQILARLRRGEALGEGGGQFGRLGAEEGQARFQVGRGEGQEVGPVGGVGRTWFAG